MSSTTMNAKDFKQMFSDLAGPIIGEAVELAVAKRLESFDKRHTDTLEAIKGLAGHGAPAPAAVPAFDPKKNITGPVVRCLTLTKGNVSEAAAVARQFYPNLIVSEEGESLEKWFAGAIDRRAKALGTNVADAGGFIVPPTVSNEIIPLLYPQSVVRQAGAMVVQMPTGTLRIPKLTGGASAAYVGENANIAASQQTFGQITMTFRKLAALVPVSFDLIRYSSPSADAIIRDDIVRQIASAENSAFLRADGTASNPKGMRYWATAANTLTSAGTYATLANIVTDLGAAMLALINANVPLTRAAFFITPSTWWRWYSAVATTGQFIYRDEMSRGTIMGYPFYRSTQIPLTLGSGSQTEWMFVDMADVVIGEGTSLRIDASDTAAYVDSTNTVVSAYSQDQVIIRAITEHDLAVRRQESIAVMTAVTP